MIFQTKNKINIEKKNSEPLKNSTNNKYNSYEIIRKILFELQTHISVDRVRLYLLSKNKSSIIGIESVGKLVDNEEFRKIKIPVNDDKVIKEIIFEGQNKIFEPYISDPLAKKLKKDKETNFAAVSVRINNEPSGMIIADNKISKKRIEDKDLNIMKLYSDIIAKTLESLKYKREYKKELEDLNAIIDIANTINKANKLSEILDFIIIKIIKIINISECNIYLYDENKKNLNLKTAYNTVKINDNTRTKVSINECKHDFPAIFKKRIQYIKDISKIKKDKYCRVYENKLKSFISIPIIFENKSIGLINLKTMQIESLDERLMKILEGIANQAAIAIKNNMLYNGLNEKINESKLLNKINSSITKTTNIFESIEILKNHLEKYHSAKVNVIFIHNGIAISKNNNSKIKKNRIFEQIISNKKIKIIKKEDLTEENKINTKDIIFIPVLEKNKCTAIIEVIEKDITPEKISFYNNLNEVLKVASHNKDLYKDITHKNSELEKINENLDRKIKSLNIIQMLGTKLSDIKNPDKIIETFYSYVKNIYPQEKICIAFIKEEFPTLADNEFNVNFLIKKMKDNNLKYGISGIVFKTGKMVICNNVSKNKNYVPVFTNTKAQMTLPIKIRNETFGILTIESFEKDKFLDKDKIETLKILIDQIAKSLENSSLLKNLETKGTILKKKIRELYAIGKTLKNLKKTITLDETKSTLESITSTIVNDLGFDYSAIKLYDQKKKELTVEAMNTSEKLKKKIGNNIKNLPKIYENIDKKIINNLHRINKEHINIEELNELQENNFSKITNSLNVGKILKIKKSSTISNVLENNKIKKENNNLSNNKTDKKNITLNLINKTIFLLRDENKFYGTLSVGKIHPEKIKVNEIQTFTDIANQALIAIKDSLMLQEIRNFNERMKEEVSEKTKKLQEVNNLVTNERNKIRNIIDLMADGLVVTTNTGKITLVNNAFEKLFDTNRNKIRGENFEKTLSKLGSINISPKENSKENEKEYFLDKGKKHISVKKTDLLSDKNDIGDIYVIQDITKIKEINKMKTEFVSNVSHELRTPLTSILGYTKLLLSERLGTLEDKQKEGLKIINDESERLTRLINDVLDMSKLEAGKVNFNFKPNNIITLIEEVRGNFQNVITEKELLFKIKIEKNVPTVAIFDYDKIKQVFINLLSNAFKFTPNKGKISITVKSKDGLITTSIKDNGEGIPKENIKNLFNKFYQVDSSMTRKQGGSGLGLAISKEIIEKHNGKIYVESDLGKGSNFIFKIPLIANKLSDDVRI